MDQTLFGWHDQIAILLKVAFAMILGAVIGINREEADKPAGIRTHMFVSGAGALFIFIGDILLEHFSAYSGSQLVRTDTFRLVSAVIAGVSFIGAGTIIRNQGDKSVEGVTTAASLLFTVIIGLSVGLGQYVLAIGATVYSWITLKSMHRFEKYLRKNKKAVEKDDVSPDERKNEENQSDIRDQA
jgi:putative Mg2+ transporter-C (MgtC) family protein